MYLIMARVAARSFHLAGTASYNLRYAVHSSYSQPSCYFPPGIMQCKNPFTRLKLLVGLKAKRDVPR